MKRDNIGDYSVHLKPRTTLAMGNVGGNVSDRYTFKIQWYSLVGD
jgi:hypothetical protein